jgi:hypothetical protein
MLHECSTPLTIPQRLLRFLTVALTPAEKERLSEYVAERGCAQFRKGEPCIQRNNSPMVGLLHAGCAKTVEMLALVAKA